MLIPENNPRYQGIYEDQFGPVKLESSFQDMFEKQDVFFRMI